MNTGSYEECAAKLLEDGCFQEALEKAWEGVRNNPFSYELFYAAGIAGEELGNGEEAFYLYQLAMLLTKEQKKTEDEETIHRSFDRLCEHANATEYGLGRAFGRVLQALMETKAYETASLLITKILYHDNPEIAKPVLTEENMLYAMMVEIVLCERNRKGASFSEEKNTALSYGNEVESFKEAYLELKFMLRRLWFGFPLEKQKDLLSVLKKYPISSDMLSVVAKYSVPRELWGSLFARMIRILSPEKKNLAEDLKAYLLWMKKGGFEGNENLYPEDEAPAVHKVRRKLFYNKKANIRKPEEKRKIAFIFLTNDSLYADECVEYLDRLSVPEGWDTEILEIWDAPGMAAGYNFGRDETDAAIRIYLHQDTFLIEKKLLHRLIGGFEGMGKPGMIGIFGSLTMDSRALWYKNAYEDSALNLYQDAVLTFLYPKTEENGPRLLDGAMLDGVFLAENASIPWREDLFDGWHFYDISRSLEMKKAGFQTAFLVDKTPWALHETTMRRDKEDRYEYYRKIFLENYQTGG